MGGVNRRRGFWDFVLGQIVRTFVDYEWMQLYDVLIYFSPFGECGRARVRHRSSLDSIVSYRSYGYTIIKGEGVSL